MVIGDNKKILKLLRCWKVPEEHIPGALKLESHLFQI